MEDFAKILQVKGVGQVLVERVEHPEKEVPCVRLRIPDTKDLVLEMHLTLPCEDYDEAEQYCLALFNELNDSNIEETIEPILQARDHILRS